MQTVYLLDIKDIEKNYGRILEVLPLSAKQKAEKYKELNDKLRSVGGALLIEVFTAKSPILYGVHGKPYKKNPPFFNLSHSGDKVGIFLSDKTEVGFDIQLIKPFNEKIAERIFPEREIQIKSNADFAKFWAMKEAAAKLTGEGIVKPEKRLVSDINENAFKFCGEKVYYKNFVKNEYAVTACSYSKIDAEISEITIKELMNY